MGIVMGGTIEQPAV